MMQKEYQLTKAGIRPINSQKEELKVNIIVSNENCECPLYTYYDIPESRIKEIFSKEIKKGNMCEVE